MSENLPADDDLSSDELDFAADSDQRFNKMVLVGDQDWVQGVIRRLHLVKIAEAGLWTRLLPTKHQGEVISTLRRRRTKT